jgi:hypothetical protein
MLSVIREIRNIDARIATRRESQLRNRLVKRHASNGRVGEANLGSAAGDFAEFVLSGVFHFVGFVGLLPLGVVPCVGDKLGPHLKARKHFFKVFSDRA